MPVNRPLVGEKDNIGGAKARSMKYQDGLTQILILAAIAFCCPGLFNAMTGLGGAGNSTGSAASIANATLYGCFAVFGYFGGAFFNKLGNRVLILVGGLTYAFYSFGMYMCGVHDDMEWLAALSGGILGFGAAWFWTAQGAMMMSYATPANKGKYIAIFWAIFNLGGTAGGLLSFALNYRVEAGKANPKSYFTFVVLMLFGSLGSFLLLPPHKVRREDGEFVVFDSAPSIREEIWGALSVSTRREMLILIIPFLASNWFYTYQFSGYNLNIFNTRTRGLNSALYWGSQMLGAYVLGRLLDNKNFARRRRGWLALIITLGSLHLAFGLGSVVQHSFYGGFEKDLAYGGGLFDVDFWDSSRFVFPLVVYMLYGIGDAMLQTYIYWLLATLGAADTRLCARLAGFYKGVQSAGAAIAWGLDLGSTCRFQFWVCWGLCIAASPLMCFAHTYVADSAPTSKVQV